MSRERALNDPFRVYCLGRYIKSDYGRRTLTVGKYRGHRLETVPFSYLEWLLERCERGEFDEELRQVVEREIVARKRFSAKGGWDKTEEKTIPDQYVRP